MITGKNGIYNFELDSYSIPNTSCSKFLSEISLFNDFQIFLELKRKISQFQPDMVSLHSSKAGIIGRLVCHSLNIPCIFTAHGWSFTNGVPKLQSEIYKRIEKAVEQFSNTIICVSHYDRKLGVRIGMSPHRLITVHNGMPDISSSLYSQPHLPSPVVRAVMIARFDRQKDHRTLLRALANVPNLHLDLIGDGPLLQKNKDLVKKLELSNRVCFLGSCNSPQIAKVLSEAHFFVLISNWEGFPRSILEAMRAGLPIVASDVGGVSEAVLDGINGYCIPRGDTITLTKRLEKLSNSPNLRAEMGSKSRSSYKSVFEFTHMMKKTMVLYKEVVHNSQQSEYHLNP